MKLLAGLFFITALIYSSVGFGGGSTYTALLVIFDVDYRSIPIISLCCNIIVVSTGAIFFIKNNLLDKKLLSALISFSIPMSFLGGSLIITEQVFVLLLGIALLISSVMLFVNRQEITTIRPVVNYWRIGMLLGIPVGLIAGITGIGGGIFLAPILHLLNIAKTKTIAATACLFILVNSIAGLAGQLGKQGLGILAEAEVLKPMLLLPLAVLAGGLIGNRIAIKYFTALQLRRLTAILVFIVAVRLLFRSFNN